MTRRSDYMAGTARPPFEALSVAEVTALALAASGLPDWQIALRMGYQTESVRKLLYRARIAADAETERALLAWYWLRLATETARATL